MCEKVYIWNLAECACKNGKYLGSIFDKSVNCDETTKSILTKTA